MIEFLQFNGNSNGEMKIRSLVAKKANDDVCVVGFDKTLAASPIIFVHQAPPSSIHDQRSYVVTAIGSSFWMYIL